MEVHRSKSIGKLPAASLVPQQYDFKSSLSRLALKRPITPSPIIAFARVIRTPALHRRVVTWDRMPIALTTRASVARTKGMDYPQAVLKALQPLKSDRNVGKAVAKGGGFTTFGLCFQGSPGRIPRLLSKRDFFIKANRKKSTIRLAIEPSIDTNYRSVAYYVYFK